MGIIQQLDLLSQQNIDNTDMDSVNNHNNINVEELENNEENEDWLVKPKKFIITEEDLLDGNQE